MAFTEDDLFLQWQQEVAWRSWQGDSSSGSPWSAEFPTPTHMYWTGGPAFQALGLSDTDPVDSWPSEVSASHMVKFSDPTRPVVNVTATSTGVLFGDGGSATILNVDTDNIAQPYSMLVVGQTAASDRTSFVIAHGGFLGGGGPQLATLLNTKIVAVAGANAVSDVDLSTELSIFAGVYNGASSKVRAHGTTDTVLAPTSPGAGSLIGFSLGANGAGTSPADEFTVYLAAVYAFDVLGDAKWAALEAWIKQRYPGVS